MIKYFQSESTKEWSFDIDGYKIKEKPDSDDVNQLITHMTNRKNKYVEDYSFSKYLTEPVTFGFVSLLLLSIFSLFALYHINDIGTLFSEGVRLDEPLIQLNAILIFAMPFANILIVSSFYILYYFKKKNKIDERTKKYLYMLDYLKNALNKISFQEKNKKKEKHKIHANDFDSPSFYIDLSEEKRIFKSFSLIYLFSFFIAVAFASTWSIKEEHMSGSFEELHISDDGYIILYSEYNQLKTLRFPEVADVTINRISNSEENSYEYNYILVNKEVSLKNKNTKLILNVKENN